MHKKHNQSQLPAPVPVPYAKQPFANSMSLSANSPPLATTDMTPPPLPNR